MTITTNLAKAAAISALTAVTFTVLASGTAASADPLPYGPTTCIQGYVWREAALNDHVCVPVDIRMQTAQQNSQAAQNREPNGGAYGPDTCKQGFVWRDAFAGDHICVTPEARTQTAVDNAVAASRMAANQPAASTTDLGSVIGGFAPAPLPATPSGGGAFGGITQVPGGTGPSGSSIPVPPDPISQAVGSLLGL